MKKAARAIAATALLANSAGLFMPEPGNGNLRPGTTYLANEARFNSAYYSEAVSGYILGWRDTANIQATLDFLFPPVLTGRRFEFKKMDNDEIFLSESDDVRGIGSDFKRVEYKGSTALGQTLNKGLTFRVDRNDTVAQMPGFENAIAQRLKQRLLRNDLRRAISGLAGAANNTAKTWDTSTGKDPDGDVLTELNLSADATGIRNNRVLYGEGSWTKRLLSIRAQNNVGGYASGFTPEALKGFFLVDQIMTSSERYTSAAATKTKITPDIVLMFYGEDGVGPEDPTHSKRFYSLCDNGSEWAVYVEPVGSKFIDITVEHYNVLTICATSGLRKLTIS